MIETDINVRISQVEPTKTVSIASDRRVTQIKARYQYLQNAVT
jgi:hypothetical protein